MVLRVYRIDGQMFVRISRIYISLFVARLMKINLNSLLGPLARISRIYLLFYQGMYLVET